MKKLLSILAVAVSALFLTAYGKDPIAALEGKTFIPVKKIPGKSYAFGKYEVTQKEYKSVMGKNPSHFKGANLPVENVSWSDAIKFCKKLTARERKLRHISETQEYRLPTSEEWEHACRAGTTTKFYTGDSEADLASAGWYKKNSGDKTHPVGKKKPNAFGLYDMLGNVRELTSILTTSGMESVSMGGSWRYSASLYGSLNWSGDSQGRDLGFRVVLDEVHPYDVPETIKIPGKPYAFGKYPVTQEQYKIVMGSTPSYSKGENLPVVNVSWDGAIKFCEKLTARERKLGHISETQEYRLPTSEEWEQACRAGTKTKFYTGDSEADLARAGWYNGNSGHKTHPVGEKEPNAFGLYDMHGNVWEWTSTPDGSIRVMRGGGWGNSASNCESSARYDSSRGFRNPDLGFRVVLAEVQ